MVAQLFQVYPVAQFAQRVALAALAFEGIDGLVSLQARDEDDGAGSHAAFKLQDSDGRLEEAGMLKRSIGQGEVQTGEWQPLPGKDHQRLQAARPNRKLRRVRLDTQGHFSDAQGSPLRVFSP